MILGWAPQLHCWLFPLFRSNVIEESGRIEDSTNKHSEEELWDVIGSYMQNFVKYQGLIQKKCKTLRIYCFNSYSYLRFHMTLVFFSSEHEIPLL